MNEVPLTNALKSKGMLTMSISGIARLCLIYLHIVLTSVATYHLDSATTTERLTVNVAVADSITIEY